MYVYIVHVRFICTECDRECKAVKVRESHRERKYNERERERAVKVRDEEDRNDFEINN